MALNTPLRKRQPDGALYARAFAIEAKLTELAALPREQILEQCAIQQRANSNYVPSECLLYLLRACRHDNKSDYFDRLYRFLIERVLRALPRTVSQDGRSESATNQKIREYVMDRFIERIIADRTAYNEGLDYYEVRFDGALHKLKLSGRKKAWREAGRSQLFEINEETGELPPEIERAAGSYDPLSPEESFDQAYPLRLEAAINTLPEEQIRIIAMLRLEIPIESQDPGVVTISKSLGRTPKTIRKYRDMAFAELRKILRSEDEQ